MMQYFDFSSHGCYSVCHFVFISYCIARYYTESHEIKNGNYFPVPIFCQTATERTGIFSGLLLLIIIISNNNNSNNACIVVILLLNDKTSLHHCIAVCQGRSDGGVYRYIYTPVPPPNQYTLNFLCCCFVSLTQD